MPRSAADFRKTAQGNQKTLQSLKIDKQHNSNQNLRFLENQIEYVRAKPLGNVHAFLSFYNRPRTNVLRQKALRRIKRSLLVSEKSANSVGKASKLLMEDSLGRRVVEELFPKEFLFLFYFHPAVAFLNSDR